MPLENSHLVSNHPGLVVDCGDCQTVLFENGWGNVLEASMALHMAEAVARLHLARTLKEGKEHRVEIIIYHSPQAE